MANLSKISSKFMLFLTILFLIEKIDLGLPVIEKSKLFSLSLVLIGFENFKIYFSSFLLL